MYRETTVTLNSLDLALLVAICDRRIEECDKALVRHHANRDEIGLEMTEQSLRWIRGARERLQEALDRINGEIEHERVERQIADDEHALSLSIDRLMRQPGVRIV